MTPRRLFVILWTITGFITVYVVASAIIDRQTTGVLMVTTPSKTTSISISQLKSQAQIIGVGGAKVRIHSGTYQVSANNGNKQATTLVTVRGQGLVAINLNPTTKSKLPSVNDIAFIGTDRLIDHGLTSGQLQSLKGAFFSYDASANKITIVSGSVSEGPRDRSAPSPIFSITFKVTIDSTPYSAKLVHSFSDSVELILYDGTNSQVFDSGLASSS